MRTRSAPHARDTTLSPAVSQAILRQPLASSATRPDPGLSRREVEVLQLMIRGQTNPQIADALIVSRGTVNLHVSNILRKLGVERRTQAVALALHERLVA